MPTLQSTESSARSQVSQALHALRTIFPLEHRIACADPAQRRAYVSILAAWIQGKPPAAGFDMTGHLQDLARLDAVVVGDTAIGCYPFSACATGIRAMFGAASVDAMCAIDALAIARLAATQTRVVSACDVCAQPLAITVEANGGLAHEHVAAARVAWYAHANSGQSCSRTLCRAIRFVCPTCAPPAHASLYTLPQAAAIGNAFFGFQRLLLAATPVGAASD